MAIFIVGIGGTTRPNSSTEKALRVSLRAAAELGAETLLLGGEDILLPFYAPENTARTPQALRLAEVLKRAAGVIVASPSYHGTVSGIVKNALDYVEDLREATPAYLDGRAVGCIATGAGWQATVATLNTLRSIVHALRGWPTPLGATLNTSTPLFDPDGNVIDDKVRFQLETVGRQVVEFAKMRGSLSGAVG